MRKAFDTIDHELLLKKLQNLGIRGITNDWLNSYLNDRKQFVSLNNTSSTLLQVLCGVPQGSVLGPLLFILYINDICNVSKLLRLILFADDTNLFRSSHNLEQLCSEVSQELSKLDTWFAANKLSLNVSKTNFIVFCGKKSVKDIKITINTQEIERVYSTKFLGVTIDANLTWKEHISNIRAKLSKCLAILFKSSKLLDINSLRSLYCSLFLPYINYCSEVRGTTYKNSIKCISILQKKAIRIICNSERNAHTSCLFHQLKLLKFDDLVDLKCALLMYRIRKNDIPINLAKHFAQSWENKSYSLRNKEKFKINYIRTTQRSHSLSSYGVKLYNSLPESLTSLKHKHIFKRKYTVSLINMYT